MTSVNPLLSTPPTTTTPTTPSTSSSSSTSNLASTLNLSFSDYLQILTAQLQNQDPTNATDPNQFTQELIQMGGVQQQITTNQDLTQLVNAQTTNSLATGVSYIGNYVSAASSTDSFSLQNGQSEFGYTLAGAATNVGVQIENSSGNTVATFAGTGNAGSNYLSWNGLDNNGNQLPDGSYSFQVTATNASGVAVAVSNPLAITKVTGVQSNSDGTLELLCGTLSVSSSNVNAIYTLNSLPNSTGLVTTPTQPSS
jgi:flagellar basal-body rod modification protein FlgD